MTHSKYGTFDQPPEQLSLVDRTLFERVEESMKEGNIEVDELDPLFPELDEDEINEITSRVFSLWLENTRLEYKTKGGGSPPSSAAQTQNVTVNTQGLISQNKSKVERIVRNGVKEARKNRQRNGR